MLLEGGYNVAQVARSVCQCVSSLLGDAPLPLSHSAMITARDQKDNDDLKAEAAATAASSTDGFVVATKKSPKQEITRRKEREALFATELNKVLKMQRRLVVRALMLMCFLSLILFTQ
jgi:uncharacterized protein (DUF1778 family)